MGIQSFSGDFIASNGTDQMVMDLDFEAVALLDGGFTGTMFTGAINCNSVTLDVRISESQLQNLPEGTYTTANVGTYGRLIICATTGGATNCDISPRTPYDDSNLEIRVKIPAYTRLFNVGDFILPSYDGVAASVEKDMAFCVKSTSSAAGYRLTATSDTHHQGDPNSFAVSKDAVGSSGETIPYTLYFDPSINPGGGNALTSGLTVGPFTGSRQNECGGGNNASMRVRFDGDEIKPKPAGSYSGVITIKVEPN
jgi:hypothetical protein